MHENWRFETKVCTARKRARYYFKLVLESKFSSKDEMGHFLKTGRKRKMEKLNFNHDAATPCEGKKQKKNDSK